MEYMYLTEQDVSGLRLQRIRSLETDHALVCLVLEEAPADPVAQRDEAELVRRIEHHRARLGPLPAWENEEAPTTSGDEDDRDRP